MGSYEAVMTIAAFIVMSQLFLVQGGGAEALFPGMEGQEAPQLIPQRTNIGFQSVDLEEDAFSSENITFVDSSNLSSPDYTSDQVAVLENGTDSGRLVYNTPGVASVKILSGQECGGFLGNSRLKIGSGQNTSGFDFICGETFANAEEDDANFVVFEFVSSSEGSGNPELYQFDWSSSSQSTGGVFESGILSYVEDLGALVGYPVRLWDYIEHYPWYITLFYGALLAWMLIDIVQIG